MTPAIKTGLWKLFLMYLGHSLISAVIDGGVEFAIAYGMYHNSHNPVQLWEFPNTISGDYCLTIFVQVGCNWLCEEIGLGFDIYRGHMYDVSWLKYPDYLPPQVCNFLDWYCEVDYGMTHKYETENDLYPNNLPENKQTTLIPKWHHHHTDKPNLFTFLYRFGIRFPDRNIFINAWNFLFNKVLRCVILGTFLFIFIWPPAIGISIGVGYKKPGRDETFFRHYPTPQVMKLVFAIVVAFACEFFICLTIVARYEWWRQKHEASLLDIEDEDDDDKLSKRIDMDGNTIVDDEDDEEEEENDTVSSDTSSKSSKKSKANSDSNDLLLHDAREQQSSLIDTEVEDNDDDDESSDDSDTDTTDDKDINDTNNKKAKETTSDNNTNDNFSFQDPAKAKKFSRSPSVSSGGATLNDQDTIVEGNDLEYHDGLEEDNKRKSLESKKSLPRKSLESKKSIPRKSLESKKSLPRKSIGSKKSLNPKKSLDKSLIDTEDEYNNDNDNPVSNRRSSLASSYDDYVSLQNPFMD